MVSLAEGIVLVLKIHMAIGLCFAAAFVSLGIQRVNPTARHSGVAFRLLVLPGATALWPLLLVRWLRARRTT